VKRTTRRAAANHVRDLCIAMEAIAPTELAQDWDNVGLLTGDQQAPLRRILLCIDLTEAVVAEAIRRKVNAVVAYHPPIFKPVASLRRQSTDMDAVVFVAIENGIAVYSPHTALDAAVGGTNDAIAALCGLVDVHPLEVAEPPSSREFKLVVFVPANHLDSVSAAMFAAGAGRIGDYACCSFRLFGQGTFLGGESTSPTIGRGGRSELVHETRLETVVRPRDLPAVISAMRRVHPYEEPAFDVYPLAIKPVAGIGRIGRLPKATTSGQLARLLKRKVGANCIQIVGQAARRVDRAVIVVGSAGSLPLRAGLGEGDVVITGEIRHHDALTYLRHDASAIALGHWASERPALTQLAGRLRAALNGVEVSVSTADGDPVAKAV